MKNSDKKDLMVIHHRYTVVEESIDPPPPHKIKKFKNLQNWLSDICKNDQPANLIAMYKFGVFQSEKNYTVFLIGQSILDDPKKGCINRIEFEPRNMYYNLPVTFFKGLSYEEFLVKLTKELKSFTATNEFLSSWFTKAKIIILETNGQIIWKGD